MRFCEREKQVPARQFVQRGKGGPTKSDSLYPPVFYGPSPYLLPPDGMSALFCGEAGSLCSSVNLSYRKTPPLSRAVFGAAQGGEEQGLILSAPAVPPRRRTPRRKSRLASRHGLCYNKSIQYGFWTCEFSAVPTLYDGGVCASCSVIPPSEPGDSAGVFTRTE